MDKIQLKAPAKINLFLKVLGKREDNYHNIYSWFQAIDLYDELTLEKTAFGGIELTVEGNNKLPLDENNLVVQIAHNMFKQFDLTGGLKILLKKNIPVSAGLGGGSSDAASTIYGINRLFNLELSNEKMSDMGLELGSDVPFFFSGGQAEITGRGEKIRKISLPLGYFIILITPGIIISTAESYNNIRLNLTTHTAIVNLNSDTDFAGLLAQICNIGNDFEERCMASHKVLKEVRNILIGNGAVLTRMTGTGPSMFGLFGGLPEGGEKAQFTRGNWDVFDVRPITLPAWH